MPDPLQTLDAVDAWCLAALEVAGCTPGAPLRWPVLGTVSADGMAMARTVVLRGFSPQTRVAEIWTDRRTPKIAELRQDPRCTLVFFDAYAQVQIRAYGAARVETQGSDWEAAFARISPGDLLNYATRMPPGSVLSEPEASADPGMARENFARILVSIDQMDVLKLVPRPGWRARLDWRPGYGHSWCVR
ncbi:MAG: pyridoxamine 5'-phosphate oxidase family protein [Hyphomonadaceae bacterium]|nr:pyridoxamine 5'-phosphate oxidase family protein [Hyphomonadaceae bacterium]